MRAALTLVCALTMAGGSLARAQTAQDDTPPAAAPAETAGRAPTPAAEPSEEPSEEPGGEPSSAPAPTSSRATTGQAASPTSSAADAPAERVLDETQDPPSRGDEGDEDEEENWGVFWIEAQAGYSFVNLVQFSADNFIPEAEKLEGSGFFGGAALGFRVYFLTLGARATIASYFGFEVGTVGADIAVHLPIPVVSPYVRVGLGYAWMGDANWNDPALSQTDVHGLVADGGLGVNIKLGRVISLGAGFDVAFLNLGRQSARDAGTVGMVNLEESGDAVGLQLRLHAHLTFHI